MDTMELVKKYEDEMIAIRRRLHQNPELSHQEFATTELIKEELVKYGVEIMELGLETGVVGIIRGAKPGKTVAIREDIDALPIKEQTGLSFASKNDGVCHACGHDIHTTTLLYCAKALSELKNELCGTVKLLFQPAEEKGSGAKMVVAHGAMENPRPDVFIGLHVSPEYPAGSIALKKGPANASCDLLSITVKGKGGHGAHPDNCVDPIAISAYLITQLQTVVSRENPPVYPAVLTIGSIHGGLAQNVIPDEVTMGGTLRSLNPESRARMQDSVERIVKGCCEAMKGTGEVAWVKGMPPLVNSDEVIDGLAAAADKVIGADHVYTVREPSTGSEDFSYMFPEFGPGAQFRLGSGNDDPNSRHGLHNAGNIFDDKCLATGAAVMIQFVRDALK